MNKKLYFILSLLLSVGFSAVTAQAQEAQTWVDLNRTQDRFPSVRLGAGAGGFYREGSGATHVSADLALNFPYFQLDASTNAGWIGRPDSGERFIEARSRLHLIFLGVSDFTYRETPSGDTLRTLGGFSVTASWKSKVKFDISFGPSFFRKMENGTAENQYGFQAGAMLTLNFWRFESETRFSWYQNFTINASDLNFNCDLVTTSCETDGLFNDLVYKQDGGFIVSERFFISIFETEHHRVGPEIEVRYEQLPWQRNNLWMLGSLRWRFGTWL